MSRGQGRVYWRRRGGARRAYGDFREFRDVGGGQEALVVPGEKGATTDPRLAEVLAAKRLEQLDGLRARSRDRAVHGLPKDAALAAFASDHLVKKSRAGRVTAGWLEETEHHLNRAIAHFGAERELSTITVADVTQWASELLESRPSGRRRPTMSPGTARHHLNALSNLYRRAQAEGCVVPGYNPVAAMLEKPVGRRREAEWFEVPDAALFLEAARRYTAAPGRDDAPAKSTAQPRDPAAYALVATFLLTGGRESEVLGLEVGDVSFDRKTITMRQNDWRRIKTLTSFRTVPLWPQLEEILRPYVFGARPPGQLLFPSFRTGREAMRVDCRKLLDAIAVRAGWQVGEIRSKRFRHTYCAARLQTIDQGAPVSQFTVARELGHGGDALVKRVYGHLGQVRHRAEVMEYRVEQHAAVLEDRLAAMRE